MGGKPIYDGKLLGGAQDVVVVTINYRLGALGFLTLPALDAAGVIGAMPNIPANRLADELITDVTCQG